MADFGVEGLFSAKETISDSLRDIATALRGTSEEADEANDEMQGLAASLTESGVIAESVDDKFGDVQRAIDEIGDEATATTAELGALQGALTSTSLSASAFNLGEGVDGFGQDELDDAMINAFSGDGEILDPAEFGETSFADFIADDKREINDVLDDIFGEQLFADVEDAQRVIEDVRRREVDIDRDQLGDDRGISAEGLGDVSGAIEQAQLRALEKQLDDVEDEADEASVSLTTLTSAVSSAAAASLTGRSAMDAFEDELDDAGDEALHAASKLGALAVVTKSLGPEFSNLSLNVGPFNLALKNLLITIPSLLAILGPLLAVLTGIVAALGAVTVAASGFMAIGFLQFAEELENRFAGIENTSQALMTIMEGLGMAFRDAIQPLAGATLGGMGPIESMIQFLQTIILLTRNISEGLATILELPATQRFIDRIADELVVLSEEFASMGEGDLDEFAETLSLLADIITFTIDMLPEFISFSLRITNDMLPPLAELTMAFIRFGVVMTEVGTEVFEVLGPAMALVIEVSAVLIDTLNSVKVAGRGLVSWAIVAGAALVALYGITTRLYAVYKLITTVLGVVNALYAAYTGNVTLATAVTSAFNVTLSPLYILLGGIALILGSVIAALALFAATVILAEVYTEEFRAAIMGLSDVLEDLLVKLGLSRKNAEWLADAFQQQQLTELEALLVIFDALAFTTRIFVSELDEALTLIRKISNAAQEGGMFGVQRMVGQMILPDAQRTPMGQQGQTTNNRNNTVNVDVSGFTSGDGRGTWRMARTMGRIVDRELRRQDGF